MEPEAKKLNPAVVTLGWVSFLSDVASDMIYPLLPDFLTRTLAASPAALGLIEGIAETTASFAKLLSGWWSDRARRRKRLVAAGYTLAAVARPLVGLATSWLQVLAIRFADRVGKGIRTAPRDALLSDLVPPERRGRAFGLQRAMDNAGAVVGPLLGAALLKFVFEDERSVFLWAAVPGLAAVLLVVLFVREAPRPAGDSPKPVPGAAPRRPLSRRFWMTIAIFVLFTLSSSSDAFILLKARDVGLEAWQLPLLWAFFNGVKAVAGVPGGALADKVGRATAIAAGWVVYALSYAGFAFLSSPRALWALLAFYALFYALTEGAERALVADIVSPESRGRAFGVFHAATGLAALPASLVFGILWKAFGPAAAFLSGAAIAVAATIALIVHETSMRTSSQPA
jgi:MFS family permease